MIKITASLLAFFVSMWSRYKASQVLKKGRPLNPMERVLALKIGINEIEKIRVLEVTKIKYPIHFLFWFASKLTNQIFLYPAGMTLGNTILLVNKYKLNLQLLSHELVHVRQYQECGSHFKFLKKYIQDCIEVGYENCPFELEAEQLSQTLGKSRLFG